MIEVLRILYVNNISSDSYHAYVRGIVKYAKLPKLKVEHIVDELLKKDVLVKDGAGYIDIGTSYKKDIIEYFENNPPF